MAVKARIIDFFTNHTDENAPECVLLNAVQSLMPGITAPRILHLTGNLNGSFEQRLIAIEDYLKANEVYVTGFEPAAAELDHTGGMANFILKLHGGKLAYGLQGDNNIDNPPET